MLKKKKSEYVKFKIKKLFNKIDLNAERVRWGEKGGKFID